jgi:nitrite reductase/ring-hydroxylating ferredoxin subunit
MGQITRRSWLAAGALLSGAPCACLAGASQDCCVIPEIPADGVRIAPGTVRIDLALADALGRNGSYAKIVDKARNLQILVARIEKDRFVALDQKCTHGGGALTYVHRRRHLYCTCWGHAMFALDGSVIRWPNKQTPRPIRTHAVERRGSILDIRVEGLV